MDDNLEINLFGSRFYIAFAFLDMVALGVVLTIFIFSTIIQSLPFFVTYPINAVILLYWVGRLVKATTITEFFTKLDIHTPTSKELGLVGILIPVVFILDTAVISIGTTIFKINPSSHNLITEMNLQNPLTIIGLLLLFFLIVGPLEEIIFRYGLQRKLLHSFSLPLRIGLASIIFASIHFFDYGFSLAGAISILSIFLSACLYGYVYEQTDNLTVPILAHASNNSVVILLLFLGF